MQHTRTDAAALQEVLVDMDAALVRAVSQAEKATTAQEREEWRQYVESLRQAFDRTLVDYEQCHREAG